MVQDEHSGTKFGILDITEAERIEHIYKQNCLFWAKLPTKWPIDGGFIWLFLACCKHTILKKNKN